VNRSDKPLDFAPADPLDSRSKWDWKSKYPAEANRWILLETFYLMFLIYVVAVLFFLFWRGYPGRWFHVAPADYLVWRRYAFAWLSGVWGGCLFSAKWLYHSVAKGEWHLDRRIWRYMTPHLSGGIAFGLFAVLSSGLFPLVDAASLRSLAATVAVGFIGGYFSDQAAAALAGFAARLFRQGRGEPDKQQDE
jgi:hypothetical protein